MDPSGVTADWPGQEVAEVVDQADADRRALEGDLARLLGAPPGPAPPGPGAPVAPPGSSVANDVAFAPTQELGVLDDTSPTLPAAEEPAASPAPAPRARPAQQASAGLGSPGRVAESSGKVVVFSEEQRRQLEAAIQRAEGGRRPLPLILLVTVLVAAAVAAGVLLLR